MKLPCIFVVLDSFFINYLVTSLLPPLIKISLICFDIFKAVLYISVAMPLILFATVRQVEDSIPDQWLIFC